MDRQAIEKSFFDCLMETEPHTASNISGGAFPLNSARQVYFPGERKQ
jgi:hypothetical protein